VTRPQLVLDLALRALWLALGAASLCGIAYVVARILPCAGGSP
jgi:hypothetical protein